MNDSPREQNQKCQGQREPLPLHIYEGACPDETQPDAADSACPACTELVRRREGASSMTPTPCTVTMLPSTVTWLNTLGIGDFCGAETPERMAWVVAVLIALKDGKGCFPHGKWATIQSIEWQISKAAKQRAAELSEPPAKEAP